MFQGNTPISAHTRSNKPHRTLLPLLAPDVITKCGPDPQTSPRLAPRTAPPRRTHLDHTQRPHLHQNHRTVPDLTAGASSSARWSAGQPAS